MSDAWYYSNNGQCLGPVNGDELHLLVRKGQLRPTDHVLKSGEQKWAVASSIPGLFAAPAPAAPPPPPPAPEAAPSPLGALVHKFLKLVLNEDWRDFLEEAWKTWRSVHLWGRIVVLSAVLIAAGVTAWSLWARANAPSETTDFWSRVWDTVLSAGLPGLAFLFLKRKIEGRRPAGEPAPAAAADASLFLGLNPQQWLTVLVALFIPTLLASLVSSFLMGGQVHYWITGPLLCILGLAVAALSGRLAQVRKDPQLMIGVGVGASAVLLYAVTCVNTRWVLLFYTVVAIFFSLQLLTVAHRNMPPLRFSLPLLTGIGVAGLALALGIFALPRADAEGRDESAKLVGTWVQTGGGSAFRQPTLTFTKGGTATWGQEGDAEWVAQFTFDGKNLVISNDRSDKVAYHVDLPSDGEMLLGEAQEQSAFGGFSVMKGRWERGASSGGAKKDGGGFKRDVPPAPPGSKGGAADKDGKPNLDSPLAPKLVGNWQVTQGKAKGGAVQFTKGGKALFNYMDGDSPESVTGTYSFTSEAAIQLTVAEGFNEPCQVDVEFDGDDTLILVNHGSPYGGFGPLRGRLTRAK